jgi:hypothetical protein
MAAAEAVAAAAEAKRARGYFKSAQCNGKRKAHSLKIKKNSFVFRFRLQ